MRMLQAARFLAILAVVLGFGAMALPWSYFLADFGEGPATAIDIPGIETASAWLYLALIIPIGVLGVVGWAKGSPSRRASIAMIILGTLACLYGLLNIIGFANDPSGDAGVGLYIQLLGGGVGLVAGLIGLRT